MKLEAPSLAAALGAAAVVVAAFVVAGCGPSPHVEEPSAQPRALWECAHLDDQPLLPQGLDASWTQRGGDFLSIQTTRPTSPDVPGAADRESAMSSAVAEATAAALDLLEQRGVEYDAKRRADLIDASAKSADAGLPITFPRFLIEGNLWTECVRTSGAEEPGISSRDTVFSASLLVDYPIGNLRGDVNNVTWERHRAVSEARVLLEEATDMLEAGRWMAALIDRKEAIDVILATGMVFPPSAPHTERDKVAGEPYSVEDLYLIHATANDIEDALASLTASAVSRVAVVEAGTRADAPMEFELTYEWSGRRIPAHGVPVRFALADAGAVLKPDPTTNGAGRATCVVAAAYGEPGEYVLSVGLDAAVVASVDPDLAARYTPSSSELTEGQTLQEPLASAAVHLVRGAHAVSVCTQIDGTATDVVQFTAALERRMERDGFLIEGCGASVDVVLSGSLSLESSGSEGSWTARARATVAGFDQRGALDLGTTGVTAVETSQDTQRDAEVLALKECGRLVAAHFSSRILLLGE